MPQLNQTEAKGKVAPTALCPSSSTRVKPQSSTNTNTSNLDNLRSAFIRDQSTVSFLEGAALNSSSDNDIVANSIVNGITSNILERGGKDNARASSLLPPRPPPTRGGTWPSSILRATSNRNGVSTLSASPGMGNGIPTPGASSGAASGDSSFSRDTMANFDPQKAFDNPSMEKEYLNYIESLKQYLANHQPNSNRHSVSHQGNDGRGGTHHSQNDNNEPAHSTNDDVPILSISNEVDTRSSLPFAPLNHEFSGENVQFDIMSVGWGSISARFLYPDSLRYSCCNRRGFFSSFRFFIVSSLSEFNLELSPSRSSRRHFDQLRHS